MVGKEVKENLEFVNDGMTAGNIVLTDVRGNNNKSNIKHIHSVSQI